MINRSKINSSSLNFLNSGISRFRERLRKMFVKVEFAFGPFKVTGIVPGFRQVVDRSRLRFREHEPDRQTNLSVISPSNLIEFSRWNMTRNGTINKN